MKQLATAASPNYHGARPFLKWAGGKTQLLPQILAHFPEKFGRYHEPFLGGAAVFFSVGPRRATLSDVNADLINTYLAVRNNVNGLMTALKKHAVNEEHYYRVRAQQLSKRSIVANAARMIYLNHTCFNGLYRVNRRGQFNVPYGHYANPMVYNADNLLLVGRALEKADIRHESVFDIGPRVKRGDLVYFDPPYDPVSASSSFTAYTKPSFGRAEQEQLAELFRRFASRGVHVVLSNSDTPFIRKLYKGCRITSVVARRAINSRTDRRGAVGEVIVSMR